MIVRQTARPDLFCSSCQRFKPRAAIVAVRWINNGRQAQYTCRACNDAKLTRAEAPRGG
jgi:hypothetical protein